MSDRQKHDVTQSSALMNYARRIDAVRGLMAERGLDVVLISQSDNRRYLSGFPARDSSVLESAGWVVLSVHAGYFVTSFLYFDAVAAEVSDLEPVRARGKLAGAVVDLVNQLPGKRIGIEQTWVSHSVYDEIAQGLTEGRCLVAADGLVEQLRAVKVVEELEVLRRAIDLTDRVYEDVIGRLRAGQTEREVAWELEKALREGGAEGMAFGPSVAFGSNSAVPHHEPTEYGLVEGEPVWIDMGARLDGYCADLTRSFCFGVASPEYRQVYDVVLRAQEQALDGIRAGLTGAEGDALARDVIMQAGFADAFGHALGHGIGLAIHEAPRLGQSTEARLGNDMVVTVEPGIYRPGWGGIRIEDVVLVHDDRCEILSRAKKSAVVGPAVR